MRRGKSDSHTLTFPLILCRIVSFSKIHTLIYEQQVQNLQPQVMLSQLWIITNKSKRGGDTKHSMFSPDLMSIGNSENIFLF